MDNTQTQNAEPTTCTSAPTPPTCPAAASACQQNASTPARVVHPLHKAVIEWDLDAVTAIVTQDGVGQGSREANTDQKPRAEVGGGKLMIDVEDEDGYTALLFAASPSNPDMIAFLLKHGANPNAVTRDKLFRLAGGIPLHTPGGRTVLHLVVEGKDDEAVDVLCECTDLDFMRKDNDGNTALDIALCQGSHTIVDKLHREAVRRGLVEDVPVPRWTAEEQTAHQRATSQRRIQRITDKERLAAAAQELRRRVENQTNQLYTPQNQKVFELSNDAFDGRFLEVLSDPHRATVVCEGVFCFPMFTQAFCEAFLTEIHQYVQSGAAPKRPNTMNNYGAVLQGHHFHAFCTRLMHQCIQPLSDVLLPKCTSKDKPLNKHYGFVVRYAVGEDLDLAEHVDDAHVTLNVCLGDVFEGAEVYFRPGGGESSEVIAHEHTRGVAVLHSGHLWHGANKLKSGMRTNLILWLKYDEALDRLQKEGTLGTEEAQESTHTSNAL